MEQPPTTPPPRPDALSIPVVQEKARIEIQTQETGRVRIVKQVHTETQTLPLAHNQEQVEIERIPCHRYVDPQAPPQTRTEGEVIIVPVLQEVVEVRLLLVEEIHIRRVQTQETALHEVALRREEIHVERLSADQA